jgi:hypothetical protein
MVIVGLVVDAARIPALTRDFPGVETEALPGPVHR